MRIINCTVAFLLAWQTCGAQADPWERVRSVEHGRKIAVKLQSGKSVNGKMEAWSTDGLSVRQGRDRMVRVAKSDVARVSLVIGRSRGRKAMLVGVIAGAIGAAATAGACAAIVSDPQAVVIGGLAAAGAVGGAAAGIAALFAPHQEVVYTAAPGAVASGGGSFPAAPRAQLKTADTVKVDIR